MITQLSVKNVRVFNSDLFEFELRPLTVFCGTNSSGKSTLLKMLPLLSQSLGPEATNVSRNKLLLKGSQVDLGTYETLVSQNNCAKNISIGVRVRSKTIAAFRDSIAKRTRTSEAIKSSARRELVDYEIDCIFEFAVDRSSDSRAASRHYRSHRLLRTSVALLFDAHEGLSWLMQRPKKTDDRDLDPLYRLTFPKWYFESSGLSGLVLPQDINADDTVTFASRRRGFFPTAIFGALRLDKQSKSQTERLFRRIPLPYGFEESADRVTSTLRSVKYLGPVRSAGKRHYLTEADTNLEFDPSGDFLPTALRDFSDQPVMDFDRKSKSVKEVKMIDALQSWLHYLSADSDESSIEASPELELSRKDILIKVMLKSPQSPRLHSLADSGFGYSQVLPILVSVLLSRADSTIVIEQPELHLHPALQVRLADFFVAMIQTNRQIILETHSEHMVNAIRVGVAESAATECSLADECMVYFLDLKGGKSVVHETSLNSDGSLSQWPKSFFGEALTLSSRLLKAQAKLIGKT